MTTFVTIKPHYCDLKYGETVADRFFYIRRFGLPSKLPVISNLVIGILNSFRLPDDQNYFCEGPAEMYPVYYNRKGRKSKIITTVKESTFWNMSAMPEIKRRFITKLFSINHALITDTEFMKNLIHRYLPDMPVGVCPPFCAQPFFEIEPDLDSKSILFIGSNDQNKGFLELIEAFKILRKNDAEWNLYLLGNCSKMIHDRVEGMHVIGFANDMRDYLSKCSLYVHPARFELFGVSVLEAMSAGLIPLVTEATGVSETLKSHKLGNLVMGNNAPSVIASKILDAHGRRKSQKKITSIKCRKIIKDEFLERTNVRKFKKTFIDVSGE